MIAIRNIFLFKAAICVGIAIAWISRTENPWQLESSDAEVKLQPSHGTLSINSSAPNQRREGLVRLERHFTMRRPNRGILSKDDSLSNQRLLPDSRYVGTLINPEPVLAGGLIATPDPPTVFIGDLIFPEPDMAHISLTDVPTNWVGGTVLIDPPSEPK